MSKTKNEQWSIPKQMLFIVALFGVPTLGYQLLETYLPIRHTHSKTDTSFQEIEEIYNELKLINDELGMVSRSEYVVDCYHDNRLSCASIRYGHEADTQEITERKVNDIRELVAAKDNLVDECIDADHRFAVEPFPSWNETKYTLSVSITHC